MNMIDLVSIVKDATIAGTTGREVKRYFSEFEYVMSYEGKVQVKERPRMSKGRAFTPPKTRAFEKAVENWAKENWDGNPIVYPIRVELIIKEAKDEPQTVLHSLWGLTYNQKGDIDNLGKSILDGMNGVVYKDDKQIADLRISRRWSIQDGFDVIITRAGLSPMEYRNFCKRMSR